MQTIDEILALHVSDADGVERACAAVEGWAQSGRAEDLVALARAIEERCEPRTRAASETLADHVEDQLATVPGMAAVEAAFALADMPRTRSVTVPRAAETRIRAFASRLGYGQTPETFVAALEKGGPAAERRELLACWMHEVVLRGTPLAEYSIVNRFRTGLVDENHPLAPLPLTLLATEREAPSYMPLYGERGLGRALDTLASGMMSVRTVPPPADGASVRATRADDPALVDRLLAAVKPWTEGKHGKAEAKVFTVAPAVDAAAAGSWLLRALALEATNAAARLECGRIAVEGIFGPLFSAASNGGAYSAGLGGAYGRLAAWTSLGALVGAPAGAELDAIEALARKATFLTFRAPGPWFHDVAWDIGALALRDGGASVAVLAATDND